MNGRHAVAAAASAGAEDCPHLRHPDPRVTPPPGDKLAAACCCISQLLQLKEIVAGHRRGLVPLALALVLVLVLVLVLLATNLLTPDTRLGVPAPLAALSLPPCHHQRRWRPLMRAHHPSRVGRSC